MEIRIQVIVDNDERTRRDIARRDRTSLASGTLGLQLDEAKALLHASQEAMVSAQVEAYLAEQAGCTHCGQVHLSISIFFGQNFSNLWPLIRAGRALTR
jgi:hypothetical protein